MTTSSRASKRPVGQRKVDSFDFTAPTRLVREQARLLETAMEDFARQWAAQIASRLNCDCDVTFDGTDQQTYEHFANGLPSPTFVAVMAVDGFGTAMLHMPPSAALDHLDHALGGTGGEQPDRLLSDIEISITVSMCERGLAGTTTEFAAFIPEPFRIESVKQDPQLLQVGRPTDIYLIASLTLTLGEQAHPVQIVLPFAALQERLEQATAVAETPSPEEARRAIEAARTLESTFPSIPMDACLRFSPVTVPPDTVLELKVGDLIKLSHPTNRPLEVAASGQVIAAGVPTTSGKLRAFLVVSTEESAL